MKIDKSVFIRFCLSAMIAVSLAVTGCGSDGTNGTNGTNGTDGTDGTDGMDGSEGMDGAQGPPGGTPPGPGDVVDLSDPLDLALIEAIGQPLVVEITGVTVSSPPVMSFTVRTDLGATVLGVGTEAGEGDVRGTFDKLIPTTTTRSHWVSYINALRTRQGADLNPPQWATREEGTVVDNGDGSYTFTYTTDVTNVTTPAVVTWEPTLTHRAGIEIRFGDGSLNPDNPWYDFVPAGGNVSETKDIANTALCNNCHQRLAAHGGGRFTVDYCVTCHNSSTAGEEEPALGEQVDDDGVLALTSVDMAHMVHGIHSAQLDGFEDLEYPRFIIDCATCHTQSEATPDGDKWKESADVLSCGGCHVDGVEITAVDANTWLATYQYRHNPLGDGPGVPQVDGNCLTCHNTSIAGNVVDQHKNLTDPATAAFQYNILSVIKTDEGEQPEITFSVTDPTNNDALYDIYAPGSPWDSEGARLAVTIAWTTEAYYNFDSGSSELFFRPNAAQPVSMEVAGANAPLEPGINVTDNGDQTYTVISPVEVPASLTGGDSLAVTIEGHPFVDLGGVEVGSPPNGELDCDDVPLWRCEEIPVTGAVEPCEIRDRSGAGGASGQEDCIDEDGEGDGEPRYQVVDINLCNNCHGRLALHGENRTNNINACVTCHNGNATDIAARNQGSDGICVEGTLDGGQCTLGADCGPLACNGGTENGNACESDDDCPPDGTCERAGAPDGTCEPNGRSLCDGGSDAGDPCISDVDCLDGGFCERVETAIDFKRMIHRIHAGNSPVIFGFGGSVHDFSEVVFPGRLANCTGCHLEGTYYPTRDDDDFRWATTTDTNGDLGDPEVDFNITANTSACGSCHTSDFAASHMVNVGGGNLSVEQLNDGSLVGSDAVETCTTCHGPGNDGDVARAHGLAPF